MSEIKLRVEYDGLVHEDGDKCIRTDYYTDDEIYKIEAKIKQALKLMELTELKIKELTHEHTVIDQMMSAGSCGDCDVKYELQSLLEESKK